MNNRESKLRTSYLKTTLIKYAKIQYNQYYYLYTASTHLTTTHTSSYMYVDVIPLSENILYTTNRKYTISCMNKNYLCH